MTALKFTLDSRSISDPEMHLTNNAVQSKMKNYGKYEDGNILSFDSLRARLLEMDRDPHLVDDKLLPAMSKIIQTVFDAAKGQIQPAKASFELFGFDFLIDSDFHTWLLEVNTNPCLEEPCPLLASLVPRAVNDALKLTVDQAFPPKKGQHPYDRYDLDVFDVEGYAPNQNMWVAL